MLEKTVSRDGFSTVPSRFTSLILHTQSEYGAYTHGLLSFLRLSAWASISTVRRHRVSVELIEPRKWVSMAFTAERTPAEGRAIFLRFVYISLLLPMGLNVLLLLTIYYCSNVTIAISPAATQRSSHLSPVLAFRSLIALQVQHSYKLVNQWLKFYLCTHVLTLSATEDGRKKSCLNKNRTHDFRTI